MKKLTALVNVEGRICRFPCHALEGNWAITNPIIGGSLIDCDFVVVTHQPTGYRAKDIPKNSDFQQILAKFNALFGNATTKRGVMRKWNAMPAKDKKWVKR